MPLNRSDNTFNGAKNLDQLSGPRTIKGSLGRKDKLDFYKFTLSSRSGFILDLTSSTGNADVKLFNDRKAVLGSSKKPGNQSERLEKDLEAGTYYVRVDRRSGEVKYKLGLSITAPSLPLSDDTLTTAENLGTVSTTLSTADLVGKSDDVDYYKFSLNQISDFNATLSGLSQYVTLNLIYDANGNNLIDTNERLSSAYGSSSGNAILSTTLPAGNYFVEVDYGGSYDASTNYQLTLAQTPRPGNLATDPGSSSNTAYDLGTLSGTFSAIDLVGLIDANDFYKFKVDQIGDFNVNLGGLAQSASLSLIYDANGNGLADSSDPSFSSNYYSGYSKENPSISTSLPIGTYFVSVSSSSSTNNTRYELNLSQTPQPGNLASDPGANANNAYNLGAISSTRTVKDVTGSFDTKDVYKFSIGKVNSLTVNSVANFPDYSASMELYFDANKNNIIDDGEYLDTDYSPSNGTISRTNPTEGDYFVFMNHRDSGSNERYELTIGVGSPVV